MAILVTGGAGYIGSHLVHELLDRGEKLVVLDDLSTGFADAVPRDAVLAVGDCGDSALLSDLINGYAVDAVVHLAASTAVSESLRVPLHYYLNNTSNTRTVIEAAVRHGVRHFVFASSAAVYGHPERMRVDEDAPTEPLSAYGRSKLMSEMMLKDAAAAHGLGFVIMRFFNAAGADPQLRTGQSTRGAENLIKRAVQAAIGLRPRMEIYGTDHPTPDGTCIRDYIHVMDLVQAMSLAVNYLRRQGKPVTLNSGYGQGVSVHQIVETVERLSGARITVDAMARREGESAAVVAEPRKLRETLGWRPQFDSLDLILGSALEWEKCLASRPGNQQNSVAGRHAPSRPTYV